MTAPAKFVAAVGVLSSIVQRVSGTSLLPMPNNQDTFIEALQFISRINAIAAIWASVAAICAAYSFLKSILV